MASLSGYVYSVVNTGDKPVANPKLGSAGPLDTETLQQAVSAAEVGNNTSASMWRSVQPNEIRTRVWHWEVAAVLFPESS